jgi:hypothetical protein
MNIRKITYWIAGLLVLSVWVDLVWGQTYTVGDTVNNFSADYCVNDEGTWDYHTDGTGNVVWMNLFTSW